MKSKKYAQVDKTECVACGACIKECPRNAIDIWKYCGRGQLFAILGKKEIVLWSEPRQNGYTQNGFAMAF